MSQVNIFQFTSVQVTENREVCSDAMVNRTKGGRGDNMDTGRDEQEELKQGAVLEDWAKEHGGPCRKQVT
jgi:hypothetical protein